MVWATHEFDISAGKANTASKIEGPILFLHGKLDLVVPIIYADVFPFILFRVHLRR